MRNSRKNSIIRGVTAVIAVLLMATFMLAGCADKDAQAAADAAMQAAKDAQAAADAANKLAQDAQNKADTNAGTIATLPTEDKVAAAIKALIADYAKGTVAGADDLVTSAELTAFLSSDELAAVLANYALGADLEALKGELAKYVTTEKLDEIIAAYAKTADLEALKAELVKYVTAEKLDEILAKYATTEALNKKLEEYVTIKALETDYAKKAVIAGDIANAVSELRTELLDKLNACIADVATKASKDDLKKVADDLDIAEEKLETAISNIAKAQSDIKNLKTALKNYEDATPEIAKLIVDLEAAAKNINPKAYSEAYYALLLEEVSISKYTILRATTALAATTEYNKIIEKIQTQPTIAEELAALLDKYTNSDSDAILTTDEDKVEACEDLVAQANANGASLVIGTGADARDLEDETAYFRAFYEWLNNNPADTVNAAIQAVIATKYEDILCWHTDAAKANGLFATTSVEELEAAINNVGMAAWLAYYYETKVSADPDAITIVEDYAKNKGIENAAKSVEKAIEELLKGEDEYKDAVDTLARLIDEQKAAAILNDRIEYLADSSDYDKYGTLLYRYGTTADTIAADVAAWAEAAKVVDDKISVLITNFSVLNGMIDYIDEMEIKLKEANDIAEDIEAVKTLWTTNYKVTIADREVIENAIVKFNTWASKPTENGTYVDMNNANIMFKSDDSITYFWMVHDTMMDLVAAEINADIVDLAKRDAFTIETMVEIRELRNEIVTWLNTYAVKVTATPDTTDKTVSIAEWIAKSSKTTDTEYSVNTTTKIPAYPMFNMTFAGYDKINTAKFDEIIVAYDKIVEDILSDADTFTGAVGAIGEGKILYQALNIENAQSKYIEWTTKHDLDNINFEKVDMGETYAVEAAKVVSSYLKLVASKTEFDKTVALAHESFAAFEKKLDAANAIKTVTIRSNAIPAVKEAFNSWLNTYLTKDPATDAYIFDDAIAYITEYITDIMTSSDYSTYVAKEVEYEAVVADAIKEGKKIAADLEKAGLDGDNIMDLESDIKAWLGNTNYATLAQLEATENNVVDPRLLDDNTGINMITLDAAIKALREDYNEMMSAISNAINAIPENITEENAVDYKKKVDAALAAVQAFIDANDNMNESGDVTLEQLNTIYTAKVNIATYDAITAIDADETLDDTTKTDIKADYKSAADIEIAKIAKLDEGTEKDTTFGEYTRILALLDNNFETIKDDYTK